MFVLNFVVICGVLGSTFTWPWIVFSWLQSSDRIPLWVSGIFLRKVCKIVHNQHEHDQPSILFLFFCLLKCLSLFPCSSNTAKESIFYSYTRHINGFAATLEEEVASEIASQNSETFSPSASSSSVFSVFQFFFSHILTTYINIPFCQNWL